MRCLTFFTDHSFTTDEDFQMTLIIVIQCILANGQHVTPCGQYTAFAPCNKYVQYFETELYPTSGNRRPLCWCMKAPRDYVMPARCTKTKEVDLDRKAP